MEDFWFINAIKRPPLRKMLRADLPGVLLQKTQPIDSRSTRSFCNFSPIFEAEVIRRILDTADQFGAKTGSLNLLWAIQPNGRNGLAAELLMLWIPSATRRQLTIWD